MNFSKVRIHVFVEREMAQTVTNFCRIENTQTIVYLLIPSQYIYLLLFEDCLINVSGSELKKII